MGLLGGVEGVGAEPRPDSSSPSSRSLGVHCSKVRSLTLDSWEPELLKVCGGHCSPPGSWWWGWGVGGEQGGETGAGSAHLRGGLWAGLMLASPSPAS